MSGTPKSPATIATGPFDEVGIVDGLDGESIAEKMTTPYRQDDEQHVAGAVSYDQMPQDAATVATAKLQAVPDAEGIDEASEAERITQPYEDLSF